LIIGESQYDNPKLVLDRPANDAKKFRDVIVAKYSFDEKNVKLLLNASRQQIFAELFNLRKIVTPNDNLVIFYAGHGYWDDQANQGYWWPRDASVEDPSNWLSNSDLKEQIRGIKAAHTLLISDACFSGGIFKTRSAAEAIKNSSINIQMLYKMPSRRAMTSGTLTTVPDESVFFSYLIKRLTENTEKFLPSEDLFNSLKQAVINNSMVVPQDGVIADSGDEGGDFIFILKDNSSTPVLTASSAAPDVGKVSRGIKVGPTADDLIDRGRDNMSNKKFREAIENFTSAIAIDPQSFQAYGARGRAYFFLKKYKMAIDDFSKAIEINPNFVWAYCLRGQVKMEMRKFDESLADLNKAIEINPRYSYAYCFRGIAEMETKKYDESMADLSKAIQLDAKLVAAYNNRGFLEIKLKKPDDAVTDLSKAIEINPKFAPAYCNRGLAKLKQDKLDEAKADIAMALELNPESPHAYNYRGQLELKLNKMDEAIADFTKAIEFNARYPEAYYYRAKAYLAKKDFTNALNDVNKVLDRAPGNPDFLALKNEIENH